jgi:hypothetical protein
VVGVVGDGGGWRGLLGGRKCYPFGSLSYRHALRRRRGIGGYVESDVDDSMVDVKGRLCAVL